MRSLYALHLLVDQYASAIEKLNLDGDELENYGTVLLDLQNQLETREPSGRIIKECLTRLSRMAGELLLQAS